MAEMYIRPANVVDLSSEPDSDIEEMLAREDEELPVDDAFAQAFDVDDVLDNFDFDRFLRAPQDAAPEDLFRLVEHQVAPTPSPRFPLQRHSPPHAAPPSPPLLLPQMLSAPGSAYDTPIHLDELDYTPLLSEDNCLQRVLEVFPDISHQHIRELYNKAPPQPTDGDDWLQAFISNIIESEKYPTEKEAQRGLKRQREDDAAGSELENFGEELDAPDRAYREAS